MYEMCYTMKFITIICDFILYWIGIADETDLIVGISDQSTFFSHYCYKLQQCHFVKLEKQALKER